jgi:hypothetical protein
VRSLDPEGSFVITDNDVVRRLLAQLGLPNLFAPAAEHDEIRFSSNKVFKIPFSGLDWKQTDDARWPDSVHDL